MSVGSWIVAGDDSAEVSEVGDGSPLPIEDSVVTEGSSLLVGDSIVKGGSSMLGESLDVAVGTSEAAVSEFALVPSAEVGSAVSEESVLVLSSVIGGVEVSTLVDMVDGSLLMKLDSVSAPVIVAEASSFVDGAELGSPADVGSNVTVFSVAVLESVVELTAVSSLVGEAEVSPVVDVVDVPSSMEVTDVLDDTTGFLSTRPQIQSGLPSWHCCPPRNLSQGPP